MIGTTTLTAAEQLKFDLLAEGLLITQRAQDYLDEANSDRPLTPADYASTSGVILALDDDVWVNAPISLYNSNFVTVPSIRLDVEDDRLVVRGPRSSSSARFWLPPAYHGRTNPAGEQWNDYAFTHGDRVRISPIEGCAMFCHFCNLPYEFAYRRKSVDSLVDAVRCALEDDVQPGHHVLISGGTPVEEDIGYVREVYEATARSFPDVPVDVMMVPLPGLLDPAWLDSIGIAEISVNLEIYGKARARRIMRAKSDLTLDFYLEYLADAAQVLGPGRVRSMLLVGAEPMEDTLAGVEAVAERGCVPVLSPFRPDPATPMAKHAPPTADALLETYLHARDLAARYDVALGPSCVPCSHNTLTLARAGSGDAGMSHGQPHLV